MSKKDNFMNEWNKERNEREAQKKNTIEKCHKLIEELELEKARLWAIVKHKTFLLENNYGLSQERQNLYVDELWNSIRSTYFNDADIRVCFAGECPGENQGHVLHETLNVEMPKDITRLSNFKAPTLKLCHNKLNKKILEIMQYSYTSDSGEGKPIVQNQKYPLRFNSQWEYLEDGEWKLVKDAH